MKTVCFGFGAAAEATHLHSKSSVVRSAVVIAGPMLLCLIVTACALLQPYSMEVQPKYSTPAASSDSPYPNSTTCSFGDVACIARQVQFQSDQAGFLAHQYPRILKDAQTLSAQRAVLRRSACPAAQARLEEMTGTVHVMTMVYNANATQVDPALLRVGHLPAKIAP